MSKQTNSEITPTYENVLPVILAAQGSLLSDPDNYSEVINVKDLTMHPSCQMRTKMTDAAVNAVKRVYQAVCEDPEHRLFSFPSAACGPLVVVSTPDTAKKAINWNVDGWHRQTAILSLIDFYQNVASDENTSDEDRETYTEYAKRLSAIPVVTVLKTENSAAAAVIAAGANSDAQHGKRRTGEDVDRAIRAMLEATSRFKVSATVYGKTENGKNKYRAQTHGTLPNGEKLTARSLAEVVMTTHENANKKIRAFALEKIGSRITTASVTNLGWNGETGKTRKSRKTEKVDSPPAITPNETASERPSVEVVTEIQGENEPEQAVRFTVTENTDPAELADMLFELYGDRFDAFLTLCQERSKMAKEDAA